MKSRFTRFAGPLLVLAVLAPVALHAQTLKSSPPILNAFRPVIEKAAESTTRILCDNQEVALGTIVSSDGLILTKFSQLKDKAKITVKLRDGKIHEAALVGIDDPHDLALLKIDAKGLKPVEFKDSQLSAQGDWVASPGMERDPVAIGVISVPARKMPPTRPIRLPPPNSGYMGIGLVDDPDGVRIGEVMPNTGAARAGLKTDDVILSINGKPVKKPEDLMAIVQSFKVGDEITVRYRRGDTEKDATVKLGQRPASRGDVQNSMGSTLSDRRTGFPNILQHDQVLKPTDCGGPLVDLDGKVVGINIARAGRVESWAIPSRTVQALLVDFKAGKLSVARYTLTKNVERTQLKIRDLGESLRRAELSLMEARQFIKMAEDAIEQARADEDQDALEKAEAALKIAREREKMAAVSVAKLKADLDQANKDLQKMEKELKSN